jgi:hypothetical protein
MSRSVSSPAIAELKFLTGFPFGGKPLFFRDNRMDSRGAGGPDSEIFRIADH